MKAKEKELAYDFIAMVAHKRQGRLVVADLSLNRAFILLVAVFGYLFLADAENALKTPQKSSKIMKN